MKANRVCVFVLGASWLVMAPGCKKEASATDSAPAASQGAAAAATPAAPAAEPAPAAEKEAVTCKALITHIVEVQEAAKADGLIRRSNMEKMQERCEKADNIKDNGPAVTCVMDAKDMAALKECKDMGKLLGPW